MTEEKIRSTKKRLFTTETNNLRHHILSEDIECVDQCLIKLSSLFGDFEIAHYNYINTANIDDEDDKRLQTTQPTSSGAVTNCCAILIMYILCVDIFINKT